MKILDKISSKNNLIKLKIGEEKKSKLVDEKIVSLNKKSKNKT